MTVIPLKLPPMEVEGLGLEKLLQLSCAALTIPALLEAGLNRRVDDLTMTLGAISIMEVVQDLLDLIDEASPELIDIMDPESLALFELRCALTRIHVLAFGRVRNSRMFINDFVIMRDNKEITLSLVA